MKINEILTETQELDEIERLHPSGYEGGKDSLTNKAFGKQVKKLPGGSGFLYSTSNNQWWELDIKLWDPKNKEYLAQRAKGSEPKPVRRPGEDIYDYRSKLYNWERSQRDLKTPGQLIGKLTVNDANRFPLKGALKVGTITVDEDYRGMGLAKALYGIVLTIMKRPLLAGESQTPGGMKNWVSLSQIPGVEMKGYISFDEEELDPVASKSPFSWTTPAQANKNIDTVMGKLGGQYIGRKNGREYFAFDVKPNTTGTELEAYIDTKLSKVYSNYNSEPGLYAIWTGGG